MLFNPASILAVAVLSAAPALAQSTEQISLEYSTSNGSFGDETSGSNFVLATYSRQVGDLVHSVSLGFSDSNSDNPVAARSTDDDLRFLRYAVSGPTGREGLTWRIAAVAGHGDLTAVDGGPPASTDTFVAGISASLTQALPLSARTGFLLTGGLSATRLDGDPVAGADPSEDIVNATLAVNFLTTIGDFSFINVGLVGQAADGPITLAADESRLDATLAYTIVPDPSSGIRFGISGSTNLSGDYEDEKMGFFIVNRF